MHIPLQEATEEHVRLIIMKSQIGTPNLETTFAPLVNTFVFLNKNKDGYMSKSEMIQTINETTTGECSSGRIANCVMDSLDYARPT
ncbi:hypothetical protein L6164_023663 [Bauhinia variegata]|uniref:Uncharacterized protein n=1 Tax=Bauhinia variegata TaxID=167791 RepID=A0ACB9MKZ9_BAUVA|nr:hypothetical protein L6164_023663 [Bauhinia variegata]